MSFYIFILDHLLELLFWTINLDHLLELSFFRSSKTHFLAVQILHLRFWTAKFWTIYWRCSMAAGMALTARAQVEG